jgi:hypothetical protein
MGTNPSNGLVSTVHLRAEPHHGFARTAVLDPDHLIAKNSPPIVAHRSPKRSAANAGILWDLVAVHPKGATWTDRMPIAVLFNGPVADVKADIESSIFASLRLISRRRATAMDRVLILN